LLLDCCGALCLGTEFPLLTFVGAVFRDGASALDVFVLVGACVLCVELVRVLLSTLAGASVRAGLVLVVEFTLTGVLSERVVFLVEEFKVRVSLFLV